jgi:acetolactate synthase-1/2/3 large subunit
MSGAEAQQEVVTGAQAVVRTLEMLGVDVVFGIPGGAILPTYDPLLSSESVRHVLVRHEQGAGHAATGYAQATGKVGVAIATSGPGATNLITAIADAHMDSVPVVFITGQVPSSLLGSDAFQEADIVGMTLPVTKHGYLVKDAGDVTRVLAEAFHLASTGRPGPVLVDITKDAQQGTTTMTWPVELDLPAYSVPQGVDPEQVARAAQEVHGSLKPVLYVGGGVIKAEASQELKEFAEVTAMPVVTTLMARGAFPDSHPQQLGMPGMHGTVAAVTALQRADLVVAVGARFDDRVTGVLSSFAPEARVVHVDVDPAEIGKNRYVHAPVLADARTGLLALTEAVGESDPSRLKPWWEFLERLRSDYPLGYSEPEDGSLSPQRVIERLGQLAGPGTVFASGVGQHQMWSAQFIKYEEPRTWLNSGGLGTMGYAVPAAMGAKAGLPGAMVWAVDGDGCFQMTSQELATCVVERIPVKVLVVNNSSLGMVRQWQTLFYDGRYSSTDLRTGLSAPEPERVPDFVRLAEAYGCLGLRVERLEDLDAVLELAMSVNDRPVVVEAVVGRDAMVWPMVGPGKSNSEIEAARGVAPVFEPDLAAPSPHPEGGAA